MTDNDFHHHRRTGAQDALSPAHRYVLLFITSLFLPIYYLKLDLQQQKRPPQHVHQPSKWRTCHFDSSRYWKQSSWCVNSESLGYDYEWRQQRWKGREMNKGSRPVGIFYTYPFLFSSNKFTGRSITTATVNSYHHLLHTPYLHPTTWRGCSEGIHIEYYIVIASSNK